MNLDMVNDPMNIVDHVLKHSIEFVEEKCVGCTACMRVCPTEAIRIRNGKARVKRWLCIDCGECLRVCRHGAIEARTDSLQDLKRYRYRIAIPEVSIYGQFVKDILPDDILRGILAIGFDEIIEAGSIAEKVTYFMREYIRDYQGPRPLMSSFCPAVVRVIQIRFPELIDLIVPIDSVVELAVKDLKKKRSAELGIPFQEIGAFYLVGCPARARTIHSPDIGRKTYIDGAIAINSIYKDLLFAIKGMSKHEGSSFQLCSGIGIGWGALGGEKMAIGLDDCLAVSGIQNLLKIIEEIDNYKLSDIDYVECRACYGGCAGGPLMVDNPYRGKAKIEKLTKKYANFKTIPENEIRDSFERYRRYFEKRYTPREVELIDRNTSVAIEKLARRDNILASLPGIDCGSCGSPTCKALADDIVKGEASITYCIFKLKEEFLKRKKGTHEERGEGGDKS
jgi:Na+-translocating ferredoxin:NAD+ oxidoreductase RNF subunit RnfB